MIDSLYSTPSITECEHKDMLFLQNLPSVVVSHVLDPQPGDRVLDMCAAPGYYNVHMYYVITLHLYVHACSVSGINNNNKLSLYHCIHVRNVHFYTGGKTVHIATLMKDKVYVSLS